MPTKLSSAVVGLVLALLSIIQPLYAQPVQEEGEEQAGAVDASRQRGEAYAHLMRSLFALRRGEYGSAVEEIHGALALEPDSPDLLVQAADLMSLMRRDAEAERLARRALSQEPDHGEAIRFLADAASDRAFRSRADEQSRQEALGLYEKLMELEPEVDPEVLERVAQLQHDSGDLEGAIATTRRIVESRPGDAKATTTLAELLLRDGREEEALRALLDYVAAHPFNEELLGFAARLVGEFNAWPIAVEVFSAHAPFGTDHIAVQLFYADAQQRSGDAEGAADTLEHAISGNPEDELIRRQLVRVYRELRRLADAATLLTGLVADFSEEPWYRLMLAETLETQGAFARAQEAYASALQRVEGDGERATDRDFIRQRILMLQLELDDVDQARAVLRTMEDSDGALALESRARLAVHTEDWAAARQASRKLKATGQTSAAALLEGEIAVGDKRWAEAQKRFNEAIKEIGPAVRPRIAEIYREGGRPQSGEQILRAWVKEEPESADARYYLGAFLYQLDKADDWENEMREAFRLDPEHAPALNFVGYSLAERNSELEEALVLVQRALAIDAWNGAYLDSLGWVYHQMGRYDEALPPLERAAREMPGDSTILDHLGDVYLRLGERSLALATWNRALNAGPEDKEALEGKIARERAARGETEQAYEQPSEEEAQAEGRLVPQPR